MYRRYRVPAIWREMDRLQRDMNQLFEPYSPSRLRPAPGYPALNVWANPDGLMITAEVPGVNSDDMEITVVGETLTLSGVRNPDNIEEGARYHRQERGYGKFARSITLPFTIDAGKVEAAFKNGVLTITLPRSEADKPRKIAVQSA